MADGTLLDFDCGGFSDDDDYAGPVRRSVSRKSSRDSGSKQPPANTTATSRTARGENGNGSKRERGSARDPVDTVGNPRHSRDRLPPPPRRAGTTPPRRGGTTPPRRGGVSPVYDNNRLSQPRGGTTPPRRGGVSPTYDNNRLSQPRGGRDPGRGGTSPPRRGVISPVYDGERQRDVDRRPAPSRDGDRRPAPSVRERLPPARDDDRDRARGARGPAPRTAPLSKEREQPKHDRERERERGREREPAMEREREREYVRERESMGSARNGHGRAARLPASHGDGRAPATLDVPAAGHRQGRSVSPQRDGARRPLAVTRTRGHSVGYNGNARSPPHDKSEPTSGNLSRPLLQHVSRDPLSSAKTGERNDDGGRGTTNDNLQRMAPRRESEGREEKDTKATLGTRGGEKRREYREGLEGRPTTSRARATSPIDKYSPPGEGTRRNKHRLQPNDGDRAVRDSHVVDGSRGAALEVQRDTAATDPTLVTNAKSSSTSSAPLRKEADVQQSKKFKAPKISFSKEMASKPLKNDPLKGKTIILPNKRSKKNLAIDAVVDKESPKASPVLVVKSRLQHKETAKISKGEPRAKVKMSRDEPKAKSKASREELNSSGKTSSSPVAVDVSPKRQKLEIKPREVKRIRDDDDRHLANPVEKSPKLSASHQHPNGEARNMHKRDDFDSDSTGKNRDLDQLWAENPKKWCQIMATKLDKKELDIVQNVPYQQYRLQYVHKQKNVST